MIRALLSFSLVFLAALPVAAQQPELQPKTLNIKAARAPVPALKYRLLPGVFELEPGNAATCYLRAHLPDLYSYDKEWDKVGDYLELPWPEFKKTPKMRLPEAALREVDRGARRTFCDWETLARARETGLNMLVPEVQPMRLLSTLLAYRARLEIAEGKFDKALYTFQTILTAGRHVGEGRTFIHYLVSGAIINMALSGIEDLMQEPGSPNLYWALTSLPQPLLDLAKSCEFEKIFLQVQFPEVKKLESATLTSAEVTHLASNELFGLQSKKPAFAKRLELVGKVVQHYPAARKALIDQGRKAEEVDALPMLQVVLIRNYHEYRRIEDEFMKWTYVPFWQGQKQLQELEQEIRNRSKQGILFPFDAMMPALARLSWAPMRMERRLAALRCIEAARVYAADKGKLPNSLADISMVPIPLDPATGNQFQYTHDGNVFKLYGPVPPGMTAREGYVVNYRITVER